MKLFLPVQTRSINLTVQARRHLTGGGQKAQKTPKCRNNMLNRPTSQTFADLSDKTLKVIGVYFRQRMWFMVKSDVGEKSGCGVKMVVDRRARDATHITQIL